MGAVADDEPFELEELEGHRAAGQLWVASDGNAPVAYLLHEPVDGAAHIEQVSVHPRAARRGVGRALIENLGERISLHEPTALTLTTFTQVPWNAPYYARLGFRVLAEDEVTEGLRTIRRAEAEHGLDRWPRVCMRREP
jgi:ribosomal protein S18 acetylase RimI-like enzyme